MNFLMQGIVAVDRGDGQATEPSSLPARARQSEFIDAIDCVHYCPLSTRIPL